MWTILAFISALCLGFYDISKKVALRENRVVDVLTISVCISAILLSIPLWLSRLCPEMMTDTPFYVPRLDLEAHLSLVGALLIFGERLNTWQWVGVVLAIGTIFAFSFRNRSTLKEQTSGANHKYYIALATISLG